VYRSVAVVQCSSNQTRTYGATFSRLGPSCARPCLQLSGGMVLLCAHYVHPVREYACAKSDHADHCGTYVLVRDGDQSSVFAPVEDFNSAMKMLVTIVTMELKFEAPREMLRRAHDGTRRHWFRVRELTSATSPFLTSASGSS
jgi:hypothetical protein